MEGAKEQVVLDYAKGEGAKMWPWVALVVGGAIGVMLSPLQACLCWRGKYKMYVALAGSVVLLLRTAIAVLLREKGRGWIPYVAFAVLTAVGSDWLVETLL